MSKDKGSAWQMAKLVEQKRSPFENDRNRCELDWICPKVNGSEVQLNGKSTMAALGLETVDFSNFWPTRSPQWDGIALDKATRTLYLFEAKSHKSEITRGNVWKASFSAKQQENYQMKCESIKSTAEKYGVNLGAYGKDMKKGTIEDCWYSRYFQTSNRLVFFEKMQELASISPQYDTVVLVFLLFVNDTTNSKVRPVTDEAQWHNHMNAIFQQMKLTDLENRGNVIVSAIPAISK